MSSKYGETHDIFNTHHTETKAKLDALLAKNTEIEVNNDGVETLLTAGNVSHASIDGKITACNTGAVVISSSAIPSGASTEAKQDANNASNASIDSKITACNTGAVVVSSSSLPSGASVSAKQDTGNASIASVDGKITACNTGAVVISSSALPSGASVSAKQDTGNASIASVDGKITACNTGAVVVSSSALPSGASVASKQDGIKTLITATNTALAGTLTVTGSVGGGITKATSSPLSSQGINGQSTHTSSEIDVSASRHLSLIGSSSNVADSHEVDLLVSNVSGGTFFKTSHSGYYLSGEFHMLISNHPYKYVKVQVKNARTAATSDDFTIHLLTSN